MPQDFVPRNDTCQGCGLYSECRSYKITPTGSESAQILVMGDRPGRDEDQTGRTWSFDVERFLRVFLNYLEFPWCYDLTVRCWSSAKPTPKQKEACAHFTAQLIRKLQPKVIVCLGMEACQNVLGSLAPKSLAAAREHPIEYMGMYVITTYSPLNHLIEPRRMDLTDEYKRVFLLAENICKGNYKSEEIEYTFAQDLGTAQRFFRDLKKQHDIDINNMNGWAVIDCEVSVNGSDPRKKTIWHPEAKLLTTSLTFLTQHQTDQQKYPTIVLDCTTAMPWRNIIRKACTNVVVGHNLKFDMQVLRIANVMDTPSHAQRLFDTLLAFYLRDQSKIGNSLKTLASVHFGAPDWSREVWALVDEAQAQLQKQIREVKATNRRRVKEGLDPYPEPNVYVGFEVVPVEKIARYNAYDTYYTARLLAEILVSPLTPLQKAIFQGSMEQMVMLYYMEQTGLFINRRKQLALQTAFLRKIQEIEEKLKAQPEVIATGKEFNSKSPLFLSKLLDTTECSVTEYTAKGAPKIDKTALKKLAGIDPLSPEKTRAEKLWEMVYYNRQHRDALSKFVTPYLDYMVDAPPNFPDCTVIHSTYSNIKVSIPGRSAGSEESGGAETGRIASYDPNMHNLKKDPVLRMSYDAPPGYEWWEFDQSTIEPRINAWYSGCENFKSIFRKGLDLYLCIANDAWSLGHPMELLKKGYPEIPKSVRDDAKTGLLAVTYDLQPETWWKRWGGDLDKILAFYDGFYASNPELLWASNRIKDLIMRGEMVVTPNCRQRTFPLENEYPDWDLKTFKNVPFWQWARELRITPRDQHVLREGYNSIIQGMSSDFNCHSATMLRYRGPAVGCLHPKLEKFRTSVLHANIVHDSLWMVIRTDVADEVASIIRDIMTVELAEVVKDLYDFDVPLAIEAKHGPNLGSMKEYEFAPV